jgi:hypothetical protein
MKIILPFCLAVIIVATACNNSKINTTNTTASGEQRTSCAGNCKVKSNSTTISCKLTSPELQQRKQTVIARLKQQIIEKKELENGYAFKFSGTDAVVDELTSFIKTERACCDFFTFNLSISGDKTEAWLELTGEKGAKEFIASELGL